jgi:NAD-dependent deacetylase
MKITILSGAGISRDSGILTFRDSKDGLWNNYKIEDVATKGGWKKDRELVLDFYNERRSQLKDVEPNSAHLDLVEMEKNHDITIITQNVDDLHERAGSSNVIHLHGELLKAKGSLGKSSPIPITGDINIGDKCEFGSQLRPDVVWFLEMPYRTNESLEIMLKSDILIIVGTSLNISYINSMIEAVIEDESAHIIYIDPFPGDYIKSLEGVEILEMTAIDGVNKLKNDFNSVNY